MTCLILWQWASGGEKLLSKKENLLFQDYWMALSSSPYIAHTISQLDLLQVNQLLIITLNKVRGR